MIYPAHIIVVIQAPILHLLHQPHGTASTKAAPGGFEFGGYKSL